MPFDRRRFRTGEIIELDDSIDPGANFELVNSSEIEEKEPEEKGTSFSELQMKQQDLSKPKSGFAMNLDKSEDTKDQKKKRRRTAR